MNTGSTNTDQTNTACDYVVSGVTYGKSDGGKHITHLEVRACKDRAFGPAFQLNRHEVKKRIDQGQVFRTISRPSPGCAGFKQGPEVRVVPNKVGKDGKFHLQTVPDGSRNNNLRSLLHYQPGRFVISAVAYSGSLHGRHISRLEVHPFHGGTLAPCFRLMREQVVEMIMDGCKFNTIYQATDGSWKVGAEVRLIQRETGSFLRTDTNQEGRDNLEQLVIFDEELPAA